MPLQTYQSLSDDNGEQKGYFLFILLSILEGFVSRPSENVILYLKKYNTTI